MVVNEPLSLVVKTYLKTVLVQTSVCLSGAQTAKYLWFLDYRLDAIYPKLEIKIEVKIGVKIKVTVSQFEPQHAFL